MPSWKPASPALNQRPSRFCIYLAFIWHSLLGRSTVAELDVHYIQHHSTHLSTQHTGPAAPSASCATLHSCSRILRDLFIESIMDKLHEKRDATCTYHVYAQYMSILGLGLAHKLKSHTQKNNNAIPHLEPLNISLRKNMSLEIMNFLVIPYCCRSCCETRSCSINETI